MVKFVQQLIVVASSILLTACVTQNYDKDKPVVTNNASNNELAITRVTLGLGYLKMGNTSQAKFNLEKAKRFSPNLIEVHTAFAHYYETVDEPELAIKSYEKALSIKSNDANTLNNYGVFLCRQEKYSSAEKQFLKAISVPSYLLVSESYENLASCQLKSGDFDKAERYLSKAITHNPNSSSALFQMVRLEYAMGNYKKARRYGQKFEKVTRRFKPESLALTLKVYQQLGNQKIARNYGSMLVSMYPESWEAKQYILNGLDRIDADNLAERYQESKAEFDKTKPKKRVIVLSPRKDFSYEKSAVQASKAKEVEPIKELVKSKSTEDVVIKLNKELASNKILPTTGIEVEQKKSMFDDSEQLDSTENKLSVDKVNTGQNSEIKEKLATTVVIIESDNEQKSLTVNDNNISEELMLSSDTKEVQAAVSEAEHLNDESIPVDYRESEVVIAEQPTVVVAQTKLESSIYVETEFHTVVKGDNLYGISMKYNIQIKALRRWNSFDESTKLHIGDKIYIEEPLAQEGADE